jgi:hypothetical protein
MNTTRKKAPEDTAGRCRSMALICRQQAALHPEASWHWLSEAERLEHLAVRQTEAAIDVDATVRRPAAA